MEMVRSAPLTIGPACEHTNSVSDSDSGEEMRDDLANEDYPARL